MKLSTSRETGLLYLGLALTGVVSYLFVRANLYVGGDAAATAANLVGQESLARIGIAAELALVLFQALAAMRFYKLFKKVDSFKAILVAVFGMVNAVAILISSAMWLGALKAALNKQVETALMLFNIHEDIWLVAGLFFGAWLIPMGLLVKEAKMPKLLSIFLILGGIGYILSVFVAVLLPGQTTLAEGLPMIATVGEFWIIGYLLVKTNPTLED